MKKLSLVLAIIMIATMILAVVPFGALADDAEEVVALIGDVEFYELSMALEFAAEFTDEDVTVTLLQDVIQPSVTLVAPGGEYTLTLDGNGHKLTVASPNAIRIGSGIDQNITIKDIDIEQQHNQHSTLDIRTGSGTLIFEDVNIVATNTEGVGHDIIGHEGGMAEEEQIIIMNDVNIIQPAYAKVTWGAHMCLGNGNGTVGTPNFECYMTDCDFVQVNNYDVDAGVIKPNKGIYVMHSNGYYELVNCNIVSKASAVHFTSSMPEDTAEKNLLNLISSNISMMNEISPITGQATLESGDKLALIKHCNGLSDAEGVIVQYGTYNALAGEEAWLVTAGEGGVPAVTPYTTLAAAIAAAKASTVDCSVVLKKDITLTEAVTVEADNDVKITLDGDDYTITSAIENPINIGAAGAEANIDVIDLDVEYTGAAAAIRVNAIGDVNFYDVNVNTGANSAAALNVAAAEAAVVLDDVKFVGTTAAAIATVDGLADAVKVTASMLVANETVELYNDADAVVCEACYLVGAIPQSAEVTTTGGAAGTTTGTPDGTTAGTPGGTTAATPDGTTAATPDGTTAAPTVTTTAAPTTTTAAPTVTTTAPAADAEAGCAGCGGIAIAAQLVALVCAAAVIVIKKK